MKYVAYYRVSTARQGVSGLGLDAQRESVNRFLRADDQIVREFTEVETGKRASRPQLAAAIALCKLRGATLLIAKLDRLARNVAFVAALMEDRHLRFVAVDNEHAEPVMLHVLAAFAEHEAKMISKRVREALAQAKARGTKLGGFRGYTAEKLEDLRRRHCSAMDHILGVQASGIYKLSLVAGELNRREVPTVSGKGRWSAKQVSRVIDRVSRSSESEDRNGIAPILASEARTEQAAHHTPSPALPPDSPTHSQG